MDKPTLDYRPAARGDEARPHVRWQTVVSCSLLGMAAACGLVALVWPPRRPDLLAAAISLGIAGVIIYFPYVRT